MQNAGIDIDFVQDNQSMSTDVNTVRGLHYQSPPHAQGKLVSCVQGAIYDVAVDVRRGSPAYGQIVGIDLTPANGLQLWIPAGCLHGFVTREPNTVVTYKVDDYYDGACDGSVRWDSCGIDWGLTGTPVLSAKDEVAQPFETFESPFVWEAA